MSKKFHATLNRLVEQTANNNPRRPTKSRRFAKDNPWPVPGTQIQIEFEDMDDLVSFEEFCRGAMNIEFVDRVYVVGESYLFSDCAKLKKYIDKKSQKAEQTATGPVDVSVAVQGEAVESTIPVDVEIVSRAAPSAVTFEPEQETPVTPASSKAAPPQAQRATRKRPSIYASESIGFHVSPETRAAEREVRRQVATPGRLRASESQADQVFGVTAKQYNNLRVLCQAPYMRVEANGEITRNNKGPRLRFSLIAPKPPNPTGMPDPQEGMEVAPFVELDASLFEPGTRRGKNRAGKGVAINLHFKRWSAQNEPINFKTFERFFDKMTKIRLPDMVVMMTGLDEDGRVRRRPRYRDFDQWGVTSKERWGVLYQKTKTNVRERNRLPSGEIENLDVKTKTILVRPGFDVYTTNTDTDGAEYTTDTERVPYARWIQGKDGVWRKYIDRVAWEFGARIALGTFLADTGYLGRGKATLKKFIEPETNVEFHMYMDDLPTVDVTYKEELPSGEVVTKQDKIIDLDAMTSLDRKWSWFRVGGNMTPAAEYEAELAAEEEFASGTVVVADSTPGEDQSTPGEDQTPAGSLRSKGRVDL